jgi:hypothetical protein
LLNAVGSRLGAGDAAATGTLWSRWTDVVGDAMAAHVEPTSLRDGVLRVRADSPAWATETTYLAGEIRRRANALLGSSIVREVKVWTGPGRVSRTTRADEHPVTDPHPGREPAEDPVTAFARARIAWWKRAGARPDRRPEDEESPR